MQAILDQEDMSNLSKEDRLEYIMYLIWHPVVHRPKINFLKRCVVSNESVELRTIYLKKIQRRAVRELVKLIHEPVEETIL